MKVHTICEKHRTTALVGPGSLLSELECVTCVAEQDEANRWRPCCPQMNTTCTGHDDWEPYVFFVQVDSPGYCDNPWHIGVADDADVPF